MVATDQDLLNGAEMIAFILLVFTLPLAVMTASSSLWRQKWKRAYATWSLLFYWPSVLYAVQWCIEAPLAGVSAFLIIVRQFRFILLVGQNELEIDSSLQGHRYSYFATGIAFYLALQVLTAWWPKMMFRSRGFGFGCFLAWLKLALAVVSCVMFYLIHWVPGMLMTILSAWLLLVAIQVTYIAYNNKPVKYTAVDQTGVPYPVRASAHAMHPRA